MSDPHRQLAATRRERDALRADLKEANRQIQTLRELKGEIPSEWADAMHLLREVAHGGWRRPDDLGTQITTPPGSRPPSYSLPAYNRLREERRWIRNELITRAKRVVNDIARWVDNETEEEQASGNAW